MDSGEEQGLITCGCAVAAIAFNLLVGGWSINYLLVFFLEKTIPFWGAALIGLFAGEISVPVALAILALRYFGVM